MTWIGIDIGGTTIKGGLVDEDGHILKSAERDSERAALDHLLRTVLELVEELSAGADPEGIGLGVPGLVSHDRVEVSPNMPALAGAPVADRITAAARLPAVMGNDADMNAWGEFRAGAGRGVSHLVAITIGTGLGSGVIVDGRLHRGTDGYGAEAGHIVVEPDGAGCACGGRGCLETLVSATAIIRKAATLGNPARTAREVFERAAAGDSASWEILAETGRFLGIGLATLVNLFNPALIIVGGGVAGAGDLLLEPARNELRSRAFSVLADSCRVVPAELGSNAGVVGAALFAMEHSPPRNSPIINT